MTKILKFTQVTLFGLALFMAPLTVAQERETPPEGGTPKAFSLPDITRIELSNGVDLTLVPYGKVPKVSLRAVVQTGNVDDGDQPWIADLTTDLMEQGAAGFSGSEIATRAAGMGGNVNIGVGQNQTFVVMDVLSDRASDAVDLLADIIMEPNLPESEFARKQADVLRTIDVARARAQSQASEAFNKILFPDHPYGVSFPEDGQVEAYTLADVQAFHAANFTGQRLHLYVVGQFDKEAVIEAAQRFEGMDAGLAPSVPSSAPNSEPGLVLIDRPGAPQSTIRLGRRVPAPDGDIALNAMNTLLGGYFSSRITRNIREDKGYTYSPGSFVNNRKDAANWQMGADVTTEDTGAALFEIMKEVRRLQDTPPSAEEVQGIKNYMNGIFVIRLASHGGMAGQLSFVDLHGLGTEYLENYVGKVANLTAGDFQSAAQEHLIADDLSLVVVGPIETVREQLSTMPDFAARLPGE